MHKNKIKLLGLPSPQKMFPKILMGGLNKITCTIYRSQKKTFFLHEYMPVLSFLYCMITPVHRCIYRQSPIFSLVTNSQLSSLNANIDFLSASCIVIFI